MKLVIISTKFYSSLPSSRTKSLRKHSRRAQFILHHAKLDTTNYGTSGNDRTYLDRRSYKHEIALFSKQLNVVGDHSFSLFWFYLRLFGLEKFQSFRTRVEMSVDISEKAWVCGRLCDEWICWITSVWVCMPALGRPLIWHSYALSPGSQLCWTFRGDELPVSATR